jgi:membrane fusion protein, copper/silver efflux system
MQILGKTSMMAPMDKMASMGNEPPSDKKPEEKSDEETVEKLTAPKSFITELTPVYTDYLKIKDAIREKDPDVVISSGTELTKNLKNMDSSALDPKQKRTWIKLSNGILAASAKVVSTRNPVDQRRFFNNLSETMVKTLMTFGQMTDADLAIFYCSKAFDGEGAYWIGEAEDDKNPYYQTKSETNGKSDECAELVEKISPEKP